MPVFSPDIVALPSGVEIFGSEWSFGGERADANLESGVFFCAPRGCTAHVYREAVPMGRTSLSMKEVHDLLRRLMEQWSSHEYDPLRQNCCHFSDSLCQALGVGSIPSWVTSLAALGASLWRGPSIAVRSTGGSVGGSQSTASKAAGREDTDGPHESGAPLLSSGSARGRESSVPAQGHYAGQVQLLLRGLPRSRSLSVNPMSERSGWHAPLSCALVQPAVTRTPSCGPQSPTAAGLAVGAVSQGLRSPSRCASPSCAQGLQGWLVSSGSVMLQHTPRTQLLLQLPDRNQRNLPQEKRARSGPGGRACSARLVLGVFKEIACELLRLRAQKRSHDEVRQKLDIAEERLHALPTHAVIRLHVYLERYFADASQPAVQEAIIKQLECLFAILGIECAGPEGLLDSTRQLFRDPQCFTSRLCSTLLSSEGAKGVVPYLLSNITYRKLKDKDVNSCCEAVHDWIQAKYWFASISEEVARVAEELRQQETLLGQMRGSTGNPSAPSQGAAALPGTPQTAGTGCVSNFSDFGATSPGRLQRAISIGGAVLRAMSGSPVGAIFRSGSRRHGAQESKPSCGYVGTPMSSAPGAAQGSASGRFLDRHQSVPATLLEAMHNTGRPGVASGCVAKLPSKSGPSTATERGRAPWRGRA